MMLEEDKRFVCIRRKDFEVEMSLKEDCLSLNIIPYKKREFYEAVITHNTLSES